MGRTLNTLMTEIGAAGVPGQFAPSQAGVSGLKQPSIHGHGHEHGSHPGASSPGLSQSTAVTSGAGGAGAAEKSGDMIGPYKLLEILGEGGFGSVWLAERRDPVVQRVALKIMKPGMDSKAVLGRFDQERQALALMNHPNIARMFDAGTSPKGRPFFVMEHVQGEPISDYCRRYKLHVRERLELMLPVCDAVQHAHMRGLIHRDLKPANILVSRTDDKPVPKIIDFGIAKALTHTLTDQTVHTEQGVLIGTPEYMSPEQTEWGRADIDTRADIYSLGVVLYEVLTGVLPFESSQLRAGGYEGMRHLIRDVDPPKPSMRVSTIIQPSDIAEKTRIFGEDARTVVSVLRGDLDWITMKALEKDRSRRYDSASAFVADIKAYLADKPIAARPPSTQYRVGKWVRRNKALTAASGVIAGAALAGAGGIVWGFVQARAGEKVAREQTIKAEEAADRESAVNRFLIGTLSQTISTPGMVDQTLGDFVRTTAALLDQGQLKDKPRVEAELRMKLAGAMLNSGDVETPLGLLEKVIVFERSQIPIDQRRVGDAMSLMGLVQHKAGDEEAAEKSARDALVLLREALPPGDDARIEAMNRLCVTLQALGKHDEAAGMLDDGLRELDQTGKGQSVKAAALTDTLGSMRNTRGNPTAALVPSERAVALRKQLFGEFNTQVGYSLSNLGSVYHNLGEREKAEQAYQEALVIWEKANVRDKAPAGQTLRNYGALLLDLGRTTEARAFAAESLAVRKVAVGEKHPSYADSLEGLGDVERVEKSYVPAEQAYRAALAVRTEAQAGNALDLARAQTGLAEVLVERGEFLEARQLAQRAYKARKDGMPDGHPWIVHARGVLACCMAGLKDPAAYEELRSCVQITAQDPGARSYRRRLPLTTLLTLARTQGDAEVVKLCTGEIANVERIAAGVDSSKNTK